MAPHDIAIDVFDGVGDLPVFSPDLEGLHPPDGLGRFIERISARDGLLVSSPEYVHSIPGGLKNAIDWLVSGDHVVGKPIALVHASHRGDDMLGALRVAVSTISSSFDADLFFRLPVMKETPESVAAILGMPANRSAAEEFLRRFAAFCRRHGSATDLNRPAPGR